MKKEKVEKIADKEKKFRIREIFTNKRYYAIANLIFYPTIFLILIIMVRTQPTKHVEQVNEETNNQVQVLEKINNKNFNFRYTLDIDNDKTIYVGKIYNNKILFEDKKNNDNYYIQDNLVLKKTNDNYVVSENPVQYFNYFDTDLINKIFDKATMDKNDYIISISDFVKITKNQDYVNEDQILIEVKKSNNVINKIIFDLTDYINEVELKDFNSVILELDYYDFGLITDFNIN